MTVLQTKPPAQQVLPQRSPGHSHSQVFGLRLKPGSHSGTQTRFGPQRTVPPGHRASHRPGATHSAPAPQQVLPKHAVPPTQQTWTASPDH